jgi:hypothetical protein
MNEKEILKVIEEDVLMMEVLECVAKLHLPDWWIGAGFVRNKIWDYLHNYQERTALNDIDVIYFDLKNIDESTEKKYEAWLQEKVNLPWSVKNQARMAKVRKDGPYTNSSDGLSRWVETATCVGVKINSEKRLELTAPNGIEDLVNLIVRPSPSYKNDLQTFCERIENKHWLSQWPKLKVIT